jgi:tape measure domain-containing protein
MPQALEFALNLNGNFSAFLGPVNQRLEDTEKNLQKASSGANAFEADLKKISGSSLDLGAFDKMGRFFTVDLVNGARAAFDVVRDLGGAFLDLGKNIVTTAAGAQDLNLAVRLNVGDKGAFDVQQLADIFQKRTRFDDDQVKESLLPLLDVGISDKNLLGDLATAASDISVRRKSGLAGMQGALGAFQRIALKGEVDGRALRELAIGEADYFKDLGGLLGITAEQAKKAASEGKIKSQTLLSVALNQVAQREGGSLGNASIEGGKTLGATLARLQNLQGNLLKQMADSPGLKRFQGVLDNFVEVMLGPTGERIVARLDSIFSGIVDAVFGSLEGPDGAKRLTEIIDGWLDSFDSFVKEFRAEWPDIKAGLTTAKDVAVGLLEVMGQLTPTLKMLGSVLQYTPAGFLAKRVGKAALAHGQLSEQGIEPGLLESTRIGGRIFQGMAVDDAIKQAHIAGKEMGEAVVSGCSVGLDAHSPSRKLQALGRYAAEGFAIGLDGGEARVEASVRGALVSPTTDLPGVPGSSAGGRGQASIQSTVQVIAQAHDAEGIARELEPVVRRVWRDLLDEVGFTVGAGDLAGEAA